MQQQQSAGGMSQGGIGRCPSTIVTLSVSQERLNRGGARPIFPSSVALPTLQNMQRLQQQPYGGMQQGSMGGLQQGSMGVLQQGSMGALPQGSLGGQTQQGMGGQPEGYSVQLQLALLQQQQQQQQQQPQGSLGGLMQGSALSGGTQGLQGMPSVVGQGSLGGSGCIGSLSQQDQLRSLLGGGAASQNSNLFGGLQQQQSSLLSALQNQQGGMLSGQGSGGQLGGSLLTASLSSSPQVGLLGAGLMPSSQGLSPQKSQCTLGGLGAFGGSSVLPTSRASKPLLQAMETLKGGAPGVQAIAGTPAAAGLPAPIVMSQPVTSAGLAPQMQHLLLRGMPGYTSTLVVILVPQD